MNDMEEILRFHYHTSENMKPVNANDICHIYGKLVDDESKLIFIDRLLFSLTNDWKFIRDMLLKTGIWNHIDRILTSKAEMPIYIYGAGISGSRPPLIFPEYNWTGYIDKNKIGQTCNGLPIYEMEKCKELQRDALVIISNLVGGHEIKKELVVKGIPEDNIITYADYIKEVSKDMYFEDACIDKTKLAGKAFIDAGAFDGSDTIRFLDWVDDGGAKSIIFEADSDNFQLINKNLAAYPQVRLYNCGLSDREMRQPFLSGKGEMSNFSSEGDAIIQMVSLDNIIADAEVGYIKMDIEGFEKAALQGAKKIISHQHPVLGISVYHKREDIWEIPSTILEVDSGYKFFLRHYSLGVVDTVLYAL